jgi:hypothetical protein
MSSKLDVIQKLLDPRQMRSVELAVTRIVAQSFHEDAKKAAGLQGRVVGEVRATEREVRRRANIAWDWFIAMRAECGFSSIRAVDLLPAALRSELEGVPWIPPPPERAWRPTTR